MHWQSGSCSRGKRARAVWLFPACSLLLPTLTFAADPIPQSKIDHAWDFAATQLSATSTAMTAAGTNRYPTVTISTPGATYGNWSTTGGSGVSWHAGFFPGQLFYLYNRNGSNATLNDALARTAPLTGTFIPQDHDIGFVTMTSWGNVLKYAPNVTDQNAAKGHIQTAAATLNGRFRSQMGLIDSWIGLEESPNASWGVCIDNMMNIGLLFKAHQLDNTKTAYYQNAVTHAASTAAKFLRPDGSTYHIVRHFDNTSATPGAILRKSTRQGYGDETTWSRGQAWAMYGFAETYEYTKDDAGANPATFLNAARSTADYFLANLPANLPTTRANYLAGDFVAPSDFDAETGEPLGGYNDADNDSLFGETNSGSRNVGQLNEQFWTNDRMNATGTYTLRDTSASAIAAAALLRMAQLDPDAVRRQAYFDGATDILNSLLTYNDPNALKNYLGDGVDTMGLLARGSANWGTANQSLVYGDYYFLEALTLYSEIAPNFEENVPEPASLCVLGLGALALLRRRFSRV